METSNDWGLTNFKNYYLYPVAFYNKIWDKFDMAYSGNPPYHSRAMGGLQNLVFKNITIDGNTVNNVIYGHDSSAMVSDVTFENIRINGKAAQSLSDANITTNEFTSNIRFINP